ncbi:hypothetical protein NRB20_25710 [Nocardia sp. RB20]|uniref:Uncharacterized protein n=2 Tax=Nocardia macrotermitis TaxID=2585198 RepID=A0A7K0D1C0_9NOCA|nr:hypothetical protein [Nocardia macrotermitis]
MQLNSTASVRRWIFLVIFLAALGAAIAVLLWCWIRREGQSSRHLDQVTISGFDKVAQKEIPSNGSGDFPPTASAYFIGPSGRMDVTAPGFSITRIDPPNELPGMNEAVIYLGKAPPNCSLDISRIYPTALLPSWVHLSGQQRLAFESGTAQVLAVGTMCRG